MAGVKGKSGGARPNTGGARPGAGRPRKAKEPQTPPAQATDPVEFLIGVMNDLEQDPRLRVRAAIAAAAYKNARVAPAGIKEARNDAAKKAHSRFAPSAPPKLAAVGGRKI